MRMDRMTMVRGSARRRRSRQPAWQPGIAEHMLCRLTWTEASPDRWSEGRCLYTGPGERIQGNREGSQGHRRRRPTLSSRGLKLIQRAEDGEPRR
jgi:hypothetical protein